MTALIQSYVFERLASSKPLHKIVKNFRETSLKQQTSNITTLQKN